MKEREGNSVLDSFEVRSLGNIPRKVSSRQVKSEGRIQGRGLERRLRLGNAQDMGDH